jgi:hypothetical protein
MPSTDEQHLDVEALKKLVIDLKAETQGLRHDTQGLDENIKAFETSSSALKQQYNIIGAAADISGWDNEDEFDSNAHQDKEYIEIVGSEKRWLEANRKLEVTILNDEIRGVLGQLEKEALAYESNIFAIEKEALLAAEKQKLLPALLNKSSSELEEEMGLIIEKRLKVKAMMKRESDQAYKEKVVLLNKVARLREQLCSLVDEREALKASYYGLHANLATEQSRVEFLKQEMLKVRNEFDKYHGPYGWLVECYNITVQNTTDQSHMRTGDIISSLSGWTFVLDHPNFATTLKDKLDEVGCSSYIDQRKFVHVCSQLEADLSKN